MRPKLLETRSRDALLIVGPALLLLALAIWLAFHFVSPAPPRSLTITTASEGSPYWRFAEGYRRFMAQNGVTLHLRQSAGSFENLAALRDGSSGVQAGFLQGGIANAEDAPELSSLGRVSVEPLWLFHHAPLDIRRVAELRGKRILVGPERSGTRELAVKLLASNGITPDSASFVTSELPDYVDALQSGAADAGFLVLAPEARTLQRLLRSPNVRLTSFDQADAYLQRFPFLSRITLRQGVVDLAGNIPPQDVTLLGTSAGLLVRNDLHPALVNLLTQAAINVHGKPVLDGEGGAAWFHRAGEFPVATDPEFPLAEDAKRVYRNGAPFLQRYMPFWLATLLERALLLALPVVTVMLPIMRFAPRLYVWRMRRRLLRWYRDLKALDHRLRAGAAGAHEAALAELARIEDGVSRMALPLGFTDQLYAFWGHLDMVRRRVAGDAGTANQRAPAQPEMTRVA